MHELGVAFHIADQVVRIAEENEASHVHQVTLEIGEVSTVIPEYLKDVWNWHCGRVPLLKGCELQVEVLPAVTWCDNCRTTYPTVRYGRQCPNCGSGKTWLQTGNQVNIKDIVVEE